MVLNVIPLYWELVLLHAKRGKTCLEGDRIWNAYRKVGEHGEKFVRFDTTESKVVRDLMDSEEKIVVGSPANSIRSQNKRERNWVSAKNADEEPRCEKLERDHAKHNVFRHGLVSHKFCDLDRLMSTKDMVFNQQRTSGWALRIAWRRER